MSAHNSIIILGAGRALQFESKAGETNIFPGLFVEQSAANTFLRSNVTGAGVDGPLIIAIENSINGKDKDTVYANGETVYARALVTGMEVQCKLPASASAIVFNDMLEINGDGHVIKRNIGVAKLRALEAVDNSAGASPVFIMARVI
jgi:hypothetical protein